MIRVFDISLDIRERLFYVLAITGVCANALGFFANWVLFGFEFPTQVCGICWLALIIISVYGYKTRIIIPCVNAIIGILGVIEFPFLFYVYGNGILPYMIMVIVGVELFMGKVERVIVSCAFVIYDIFVFFVRWNFPSSIQEISRESAIGTTICTFVIVSACLIAIVIMFVKQYERESYKLELLTKELKISAEKDPLTDIYNRRFLTDYLEKLMEGNSLNLTVVLFDIDDFKCVNDKYGHVFGDKVLIEYSKILKKYVGQDGVVARFGGEEFMMVLSYIDKAKIIDIMEKIRNDFIDFSREAKGEEFTFSGGASEFIEKRDIVAIFNNVDEKLYNAKRCGKNRIIW